MTGVVNQSAVEAMYAGTALDTYLDCVDHLPNEIQRFVSQLHELDLRSNEIVNETWKLKEEYKREEDSSTKKTILTALKNSLIKNQEIGDVKLKIVAKIFEVIESRTRQLDLEFQNLEPSGGITNAVKEEDLPTPAAKSNSNVEAPLPASASSAARTSGKTEEKSDAAKGKRPRQHRRHHDSVSKEEEKKEEEKPRKKKTKRDKGNDKFPNNKVVNPADEPLYCLCHQFSYGEMICCDNSNCSIQWFHFSCVAIDHSPKGKWFCPNCRGDRSNIMKTVSSGKQGASKNLD